MRTKIKILWNVLCRPGSTYSRRLCEAAERIDSRRPHTDEEEEYATERELSEQLPEREQNELGVLFDLMPAMVWFKDTEDRILRINQRAADAVGKSIREIEGRYSSEVYSNDSSKYHSDDLEVIRTGKPKLGIVEMLRGSEGKEIWVETDKVPFRDKQGKIVGIVAMAQDVTERKITEQALYDSEEKFRLLTENLTDTLWIRSPDMKTLLYLSPGYEKIWGRPVEELKANPHVWKDFVVPEDRERISAVFNTLTGEAPQVDVEYRITRPDGEIRWVHARGFQVRNTAGDLVNLTGIVTDITERNRAAARLAANESLLKQFVRHTPAAIAMLDTEMRYMQASERWIQDYNLGDRDIIGLSHYEIFPDVPQRWKDIHTRVLSGAVERCDEDAFPRGDGSTDWLQWEARPWHDADGEIGGLIFFTQVITERKLAEEELRWKTALLEAQVDSYNVGILVVDGNGRKILQNRRMVDLWKIPSEIAESEDDNEQIQFVLGRTSRPKEFLEKVNYLYAHPDDRSADEIELTDGTVLDRYSAPVIGKDGRNYGRIWTFADITARKRDEAERVALNRRLLEVSRQAGMAEVATNVLHNVGNVLNSVNISCSMVSSRIRKSRISGVLKTAELLKSHQGDLAAFFMEDPKGQKLPKYIEMLAGELVQEQKSISAEIQSLSENIDHIKDIVALQQNLARVGGLTEIVAMEDLIEDSLRLSEGSLSRHHVGLVREYGEAPPVTVEKHKALQILVNLIGNAKSACNESGKAEKLIILRLTADTETVRIAVIDNGVGITRENLTKIFAHGFTTKTDGHGFGLHSSVLAARGMGGDLEVNSDGPGKGATFTLSLPVSHDKAS